MLAQWTTRVLAPLGGGYGLVEVLIELLLIGIAVHWCATVLRGTRGTRPLRGLLLLLIAVTLLVRVLAARLGWTRLEFLYQYFVIGMVFVALVAFQPELRRALLRFGDVRVARRERPRAKMMGAVLKSVGYLSKNRYGALIAIERGVNLQSWADTGTHMNAECTSELLNSLFFPNSPLHDLGVIIRQDRILAANCQFPVAEGDEIDPTLGSRHLAAVAMSYETDALIVIVSEESGAISIADNGELKRFLSLDELDAELGVRLDASGETGAAGGGKRILRRIRHGAVVLALTGAIWYVADQAAQTQVDGAKIALTIEPRNADRLVDIITPQPAVFSVSLRGTTRAVSWLRTATSESPREVNWLLSEDQETGERRESVAEILSRSTDLTSRGLQVIDASPPDIEFVVHEIVSARLPVRVVSPDAEVADIAVEPAEVSITARANELAAVPESQRFATVSLAGRVEAVGTEQTVRIEKLPIADRVGSARISATPTEVSVSVRVIGARMTRRVTGVAVSFLTTPGMQDDYVIDRRDPNELLIDLNVEGDRRVVSGLTAADVLAWVPIDRSLATAGEEFAPQEVQLRLPPGVSAVGPPRVVHLRLRPREKASP